MNGVGTASPSLGAIVLAILLPPIGVWLARGIGPSFWISLLLTIIGWLPGAIFALIAILRPDMIERQLR